MQSVHRCVGECLLSILFSLFSISQSPSYRSPTRFPIMLVYHNVSFAFYHVAATPLVRNASLPPDCLPVSYINFNMMMQLFYSFMLFFVHSLQSHLYLMIFMCSPLAMCVPRLYLTVGQKCILKYFYATTLKRRCSGRAKERERKLRLEKSIKSQRYELYEKFCPYLYILIHPNSLLLQSEVHIAMKGWLTGWELHVHRLRLLTSLLVEIWQSFAPLYAHITVCITLPVL